MGIDFIAPTDEAIQHIADNMREQDVIEVWHASHKTPIRALTEGVSVSDYNTVVTYDDEPVLIFGLNQPCLLSGCGIPWLLGTDSVLKVKKQLISSASLVLNEMLSITPMLYNYVYVGNTVSIGWLKRIGFSFDEPKPYGVDRKMFHRFHLERLI